MAGTDGGVLRTGRRRDRGAVPDEAVPLDEAVPVDEAAALDEAAASLARRQYRRAGPVPVGADPSVAGLLRAGEEVLATRGRARAGHLPFPDGPAAAAPLDGRLYLTSRRLIVVGSATIEADLDAIEEVAVWGDRLLLLLHAGIGLQLEVDQPRLLRVQIAAARASARLPGPDRPPRTFD